MRRRSVLYIPPRLCAASRHFENRGHDCLDPHVSRSTVTNRCLGKHQARRYGINVVHLGASALIKYYHMPAGGTAPPLQTRQVQVSSEQCRGKRYWPHLRVHCLSRGGPEGHCQYPVDRVPLCARLNSSPTAPDSAPGRKGLRCHRVFPRLQTRSWCWRALAPPRAPWHRARHSTGKGFGVATCPAAPDPLLVREGSGVATCHRARHPAGKGSGVTTCPAAPNPPPGAEGLWRHHVWPSLSPGREELRCHHVSHCSRPVSRCERALASPHAPCHRDRHPAGKGSGVAT
jgi:hypothetical protein